jgi:hypothetical protein
MIMLRCSKTELLGLAAWVTTWLLSAFTLEMSCLLFNQTNFEQFQDPILLS